ncbi:hypothetical protein PsorP6_006347 [Peronosclerospora sorghi]|uniref:Uncharacterized protein n=1 Tax=Peronosclerospora sorghi TaxID=230839 RepID=A0ACC0W5B8_9STRA|nr:hypothetical protein PsorP6_006347 [Peronosclerospora sorghi]
MKSNFQTLTIGLKSPHALRNACSKPVLSETDRSVYMSSLSSDWTQQVSSKSIDLCLDAYEARDGAIRRVYLCMDNEVNQKWTYESATGKLKHAQHQGFCLDTDPAQNNKVQLQRCSAGNFNQQWMIIDPATI